MTNPVAIQGRAVGHMDAQPAVKPQYQRCRPRYYSERGPDCTRCKTSEAHCARDGVCCARCSHRFGEGPELR